MPARRQRSRTSKPRFVRTPGGRTAVHYEEKRAGVAKCASCGRPLAGVPRSGNARTLPRSSRRPNRPFGGYLCSVCARGAIKEAARA